MGYEPAGRRSIKDKPRGLFIVLGIFKKSLSEKPFILLLISDLLPAVVVVVVDSHIHSSHTWRDNCHTLLV